MPNPPLPASPTRGEEKKVTPRAPRFKPGDAVRIADRPSLGHCRTPTYLRGKPATITAVQGRFRDPERLAYHRPGLPSDVLYKVRVRQRDLWPDYKGPAGDDLETDIYQMWLEPLPASKRRAK